MIGYSIRFYLPQRAKPERVPVDVGSRAEAVAVWKGFKLASGPERRCIQLWRGETLLCGEQVRFVQVAESGTLPLEASK